MKILSFWLSQKDETTETDKVINFNLEVFKRHMSLSAINFVTRRRFKSCSYITSLHYILVVGFTSNFPV